MVPLALAFGLGFLLRPPLPDMVRERGEFEGSVSIISMPQRTAFGDTCLAQIGKERYWLNLPEENELSMGDEVVIQGDLSAISESGGFAGGARGKIRVKSMRLQTEGFSLWRVGQRIAENFRQSVESKLSPGAAALIRGVCFNQTDGIGQSDWEAFRKFGVVHLLSASGFHVFVVAGLLLAVLTLIPIPRWAQIVIVLAVLVVFAAAAGLRPPIVRSVLMTAVALPAFIFRREADGLSAVSLACITSLIFSPAVVVDLGFQLSVISTIGLVMFIDEGKLTEWPKWKVILMPTLVATLATTPLIGFVFGEVSILGMVGNLIVAPVVALLIIVSLLSWIIGIVVPPIGEFGWLLVEPMASFSMRATHLGSELPGALVRLPGFSVLSLVLMYLLLLTLWRRTVEVR